MTGLVVIDFDDTLCMTEEACFEIENEAAKRMGFPPMTREAHLKNWGKPLEQAIIERIPGIDAQKFMEILEHLIDEAIADNRFDAISDETLKLLDTLKDSGKNLAILTSRSFGEVKHLLTDSHPLHHKIEKFYHKDNSAYLKPDPRVFDKILLDFATKPNEAVYLGDSIGDAVSAKSAGLHFIAVLESGIRSREDFKEYDVDFFATTFSEAVSYILARENSPFL